MRIAILADIHGNLTALEAVIADLRTTLPDLVLHGGDLADGGARPVEVVDCIRSLGWEGVRGNGDEMLARPETLEEFVGQSKAPASVWTMVREMAAATRAALGEERINWLGALPPVQTNGPVALLHASPQSVWQSPCRDAPDAELAAIYRPLEQAIVAYGHIHQPFVRKISDSLIVANTGSVGLPYDGDHRASYLLIDDGEPSIRRVAYDLEQEIQVLANGPLPHADWVARMILSATPG